MEWLGEQNDTFFIGQAVEVPGTAMFNTFKDIELLKRLRSQFLKILKWGCQ